ncbi:sulfurtransferase TusA family protein [Chloroflexota bacterium]
MTDEKKDGAPKTIRVLDLQGEACPYPAFYTNASLEQMASGEILEVLADGLCAIEGIPAAVAQSGHKMLKAEPIENGLYRFLIEVA